MSKLIRSILRERGLHSEKETQEKCGKCHKKPAGQDGLCDSCRFDVLITRIVESQERP